MQQYIKYPQIIIKFNKYIIVIDLEHFQNFPHCGVHLKRWKKKVHQVRKKMNTCQHGNE